MPLSDEGKAFCIFYSVVGIPFTLLFLTAVVQRVMVFSTRRPVAFMQRRWGLSKSLVSGVHAFVLAIIMISCFFLIPAVIFSVMEEDWNFLESFYFCFISLSTIGLGDYVPGEGYNQKFRQVYKVGITGEYKKNKIKYSCNVLSLVFICLVCGQSYSKCISFLSSLSATGPDCHAGGSRNTV